MISWQEVLIRLLVALAFCGAIGLERYLAGKAAGVRTHILVGVGAAIFTLISGYAFGTTASNADRIAAQVVSGIGFIGGGAILREGAAVRGLTTAAGLWAVAALGMAAGAGLYAIGALGTCIMLGTLVLLHQLERRLPRRKRNTWVVELTLTEGASLHALRTALDSVSHQVTVDRLVFAESTRVTLVADTRRRFDIEALTQRLREAGAQSVIWQAQESEAG